MSTVLTIKSIKKTAGEQRGVVKSNIRKLLFDYTFSSALHGQFISREELASVYDIADDVIDTLIDKPGGFAIVTGYRQEDMDKCMLLGRYKGITPVVKILWFHDADQKLVLKFQDKVCGLVKVENRVNRREKRKREMETVLSFYPVEDRNRVSGQPFQCIPLNDKWETVFMGARRSFTVWKHDRFEALIDYLKHHDRGQFLSIVAKWLKGWLVKHGLERNIAEQAVAYLTNSPSWEKRWGSFAAVGTTLREAAELGVVGLIPDMQLVIFTEPYRSSYVIWTPECAIPINKMKLSNELRAMRKVLRDSIAGEGKKTDTSKVAQLLKKSATAFLREFLRLSQSASEKEIKKELNKVAEKYVTAQGLASLSLASGTQALHRRLQR